MSYAFKLALLVLLALPAFAADAPELPAGPAPVSAQDRVVLKEVVATLPAHGIVPFRLPAADADDRDWLRLAERLIREFAPRRERRGDELAAHLAARPLGAAVVALVPRHRRYRALQGMLARIVGALAAGVPEVPATRYELRVGTTAPEIAIVRDRLLLAGYGDPGVTGRRRNYFDGNLKRALWAWEKSRGMNVTVVIDSTTRRKLNEPLDGLAKDLLLALERWRELGLRADVGQQVIVDINRARLVAERDGVVELEMKVVVGKRTEEDRTPPLSTLMTRLTINPSWLAPPRLVRDKFRPGAGDDPDVLREAGYSVTIRSNGSWRVRQPAGPKNPLGRIKFGLRKTNGIYLHDTSTRKYFRHKDRQESAGCVRLEKPEELARWVLPEAEHEGLTALLAQSGTRGITLATPIETHLAYQTIELDDRGRLRRVPDIYQHDVEALEEIEVERLVAWARDNGGLVPLEVPGGLVGGALAAVDPPPPYRLDLTLAGLDGKPVKLVRHQGELLVVTFVSTTCAQCKLLIPRLQGALTTARAEGVDVGWIGIGLDDGGVAALSAYAAEQKPPFPLLVAGQAIADGQTPFGEVDGVPTTWLVGPSGALLYRYVGSDIAPSLLVDLRAYVAAAAGLGVRQP